MKTAITLEKFEGPLDLLLELIEKEKLPITEIALSEVTEQFLFYLNSFEEKQPEVLADFLVIASKLIYLKSKILLPYIYPSNDEEEQSLAEQLKLYKQYVEASKVILRLWERGYIAYPHIEEKLPIISKFNGPVNVTLENLRISFEQLLKRLKPIEPLPRISIDRSISVKQKIIFLYESLQKLKQFSFFEISEKAQTRTEIIISFLAILELVKDQKVAIKQSNSFDELIISLV